MPSPAGAPDPRPVGCRSVGGEAPAPGGLLLPAPRGLDPAAVGHQFRAPAGRAAPAADLDGLAVPLFLSVEWRPGSVVLAVSERPAAETCHTAPRASTNLPNPAYSALTRPAAGGGLSGARPPQPERDGAATGRPFAAAMMASGSGDGPPRRVPGGVAGRGRGGSPPAVRRPLARRWSTETTPSYRADERRHRPLLRRAEFLAGAAPLFVLEVTACRRARRGRQCRITQRRRAAWRSA